MKRLHSKWIFENFITFHFLTLYRDDLIWTLQDLYDFKRVLIANLKFCTIINIMTNSKNITRSQWETRANACNNKTSSSAGKREWQSRGQLWVWLVKEVAWVFWTNHWALWTKSSGVPDYYRHSIENCSYGNFFRFRLNGSTMSMSACVQKTKA